MDKERKLKEAVDFLGDIVKEADNLSYILQEIAVQLEKLDRKSRQLKEDAQHARSLLTGGQNNEKMVEKGQYTMC